MVKSLILCDCMGSQPIDADQVGGNAQVKCSRVQTALCTSQLEVASRAIEAGDAIIACQQEHAVFENLAADRGKEPPGFVDLRDRAGWSEQGAQAGPKMAALVAESLLPASFTRSMDVTSHGVCLIAGPGGVILPLAERLAADLAVTALITDDSDLPPDRSFDAVRGRVRRLTGALGGFEVIIDGLQQPIPGGRGAFQLTEPRDGARSACDVVIDLTGGTAMVPAPDKREGYLRAHPRDPVTVAHLAFTAIQLVGTFEKPLYVQLEETLCAHSRAGQAGCSRCLDICPTGAITPDGDHVAIDPMICAGCGACAALCPSTAITYEDPPVRHLLARMETLARSYRDAGGQDPRLLVHDGQGAEVIRLAARFGRGLPADVIPLELDVISGFGHAEMLAALTHGFADVTVLLSPTTERAALERELTLATEIAGPGRLSLLDERDPDQMSDALYQSEKMSGLSETALPMGNRRQIARLAAQTLNPDAKAPIPLSPGAPYGAVLVDTDACTLCLSCVSLCPSGALMDNPDLPQLRFQEDACLQCGICATICPESAISLRPQLDTSDAAMTQKVLNEEAPFACIECGSLFGVKSTVERIMEKLAGTHPMFADSQQARMIQMCDNCRIQVQFGRDDNPFQGGKKPQVRTTDDYLSSRRDH
ncbi:4Fe-4S binding protein [Rhodobacteraceae bacterium F11138]|nr:4Fe-4S binding protein [Rhodobacteraceae bacterium F11138]